MKMRLIVYFVGWLYICVSYALVDLFGDLSAVESVEYQDIGEPTEMTITWIATHSGAIIGLAAAIFEVWILLLKRRKLNDERERREEQSKRDQEVNEAFRGL